MRHWVLVVAVGLAIGWGGLRAQTDFLHQQLRYHRVKAAHLRLAGHLKQDLKELGIATSFRLYLRAFKAEEKLEVWVGAPKGKFQRIRTYDFCASSGTLGPKRYAGDGQIPEGFYTINRFNPHSNFWLSLGIDYPNAVDRARAGGKPPGSDIFIHGNCVTIGCIPITDSLIEELYVLAVIARSQGQLEVPVHIFPARPSGEHWPTDTSLDVNTHQLYLQLQQAYEAFAIDPTFIPAFRAEQSGYVRLR